jgi:hypothetical protein
MSQNEKQIAGEKKSPKPKKTYQKPEFRYERVFETMALACGKTPVGGRCAAHKKTS